MGQYCVTGSTQKKKVQMKQQQKDAKQIWGRSGSIFKSAFLEMFLFLEALIRNMQDPSVSVTHIHAYLTHQYGT